MNDHPDPNVDRPSEVQAPPDPEITASNPVIPDVETVRQTVEEHFPGLWPAVDLGLSTCATLLLADNCNPVAVIYVGGASTSKTTVADLFADHDLTYLSDNFTPAAFVSHAANVSPKALDKVDLLPTGSGSCWASHSTPRTPP
ncbi:MAG: hypothetical protein ACE5MG_07065 [Candidatus Methylomirabilales bacterium]